MCRGRSTILLAVDVGVLEARLGLPTGGREGVGHLGVASNDAHSATAAAAARLEDDGVADAGRFLSCVVRVFETPLPGKSGSPNRSAFCRARTLSPHARIASGVGPMKVMPHFEQMRANSAFSERNP